MTSSLSSLEQQQLRQAEELFFSAPAAEGFAQALFFGRFLQEGVFPWPQPNAQERQRSDAAIAALRSMARPESGSRGDRSRRRHSTGGHPRVGRPGGSGGDNFSRVRWSRTVAIRLLSTVGGDWLAVRCDCGVRQRAPFHRPAGARPVRHRGPKGAVAAAARIAAKKSPRSP